MQDACVADVIDKLSRRSTVDRRPSEVAQEGPDDAQHTAAPEAVAPAMPNRKTLPSPDFPEIVDETESSSGDGAVGRSTHDYNAPENQPNRYFPVQDSGDPLSC